MKTRISTRIEGLKKACSLLALALLLALSPQLLMAQVDPGGDGDGGNQDTPIDGGVSVLLVAGAALGAKKIRAERKRKQTEGEQQ